MRCIDPLGADELYRRSHRANLGVVTVDDASVASDPRRPDEWKGRIAAPKFFRYKAFLIGRFELARARDFSGNLTADEVRQFDAFARWDGLADPEGLDDPRHLPLPVFDPGQEWPRLNSIAGRREFRRKFGGPGPRIDRRRMTWTRAADLHTSVPLAVSGYALPTGFHWDVNLPRGGPVEVMNHREVWQVHRDGYINVHPDSHLRDGARCKRTWPRPK